MLRLTYFALLVTLAVGLELQAQIGDHWQKFKFAHGKKYSGAEEQKRKEIFKKNIQSILEHNLKADLGDLSYTMGINEYSDMNHDEFVKIMCGTKEPAPSNRTRTVMKTNKNFQAPAALDWRQHNAVTSVKNQGSCGSCWTFSTVGSVEGAWAIKHKELIELSQQNLVDCSSNDEYENRACNGGWPDQAMRYIIDNGGINADSCYPYTSGDTKKQAECKYKRDCKNVQISSFEEIPLGDEKALLEAVTNHGPVSVAFHSSEASFQQYKGGVYDPPYCSQRITHAVTLIGYGTEGGKDYWLLKNSWGKSWGESGYFRMKRNRNLCGITNMAHCAIA